MPICPKVGIARPGAATPAPNAGVDREPAVPIVGANVPFKADTPAPGTIGVAKLPAPPTDGANAPFKAAAPG